MATATAVKPSLTIRRRFKAAPARVYAAWTEPAQIARWFGPGKVQVVEAIFETRAGGRFFVHARSPDTGEDHRVLGTVKEAKPNEKVVYTWAWQSTPERESLVTVEFKPDGDGTLLTLTHEKFFDEGARDRHNAGWTGALLKLETFLHTEGLPSPHGKFVWNELNTRDVEGAKRFLGATLGWTFEASPMPTFTYWIIKRGDERVGGIFDMNADERCHGAPEHWLTYIAVDDVDARLEAALSAGAKGARPPQDIPGVGRMAVLQQPGGAMVAWLTPKAG